MTQSRTHGARLTALESNFVRRDADKENLWLVDWRDYGLPHCSIYVVAADNRWPCKIGISTYPGKRVRSLQTSVWRPLHVAKCYWAPTVKEARRLEMAVHRRLTEESRWLHGEWFDMHPDKASEMIEFVSLVEGVDISNEIPDASIAKDVRHMAELYHDPKRKCELSDSFQKSFG